MLKVSARLARMATRALVASVLISAGGLHALGQASPPAQSVVIAVAGDVLPESPHFVIPEVSHMFDGVRDEFAQADLVFINLEEPITRSNQVTPNKSPAAVKAGRDYIMRTRDTSLPAALKLGGVGLVGLANNHMLDYRVAGLEDTLRGLRQAGLPAVGAGLKPEAERAYVFKKNGVRVALLAFTDVVPTHSQATDHQPGVASSKRLADLNTAIWRAHQQADFVVLMIHWGGQGNHLITRRQQEVAQAAVRAGCDVVVGMHPHVLQGIEYIGRVPVFYSVGNFAFPFTKQDNSECILVRLTFGPKELDNVEIVPVEISRDGTPDAVSGSRGERILGHLDQFCRMFNTRIEGGQITGSAVREPLAFDRSGPRGKRIRRGGRGAKSG